MKSSVLLFGLAFIASSCSNFNYYTVSGNGLQKNEQNELVFENDSLRITYRFDGREGPVKLTLVNRLQQPIEIDWEKSVLVAGNSTQYFFRPVYELDAAASTQTRSTLTGTRNSQVTGLIEGSMPRQFLPPGASISRGGVQALVPPFALPDLSRQPQLELKGEGSYSVRYKKLAFNEANSPLKIRCYLTVRLPNQPGSLFFVDHSFYVSEVWNTQASPGMLPSPYQNSGDRFFL